ncbi:MAG: hypothetical protein R3Y32_01660 [Bacillota bacterium]
MNNNKKTYTIDRSTLYAAKGNQLNEIVLLNIPKDTDCYIESLIIDMLEIEKEVANEAS